MKRFFKLNVVNGHYKPRTYHLIVQGKFQHLLVSHFFYIFTL